MALYLGGYFDADYFDPDYWDCGQLIGGGGEDVQARLKARRIAEIRRRRKIIEDNNMAVISTIMSFITEVGKCR